MPASPYSADGLATARQALTDMRIIGTITAEERDDIIRKAFCILRGDRTARLGPFPGHDGTDRVIRIPRAVFEAGRPRPRRRPRLIVLPAGGPTPGDAA